ncbi:hypothetical protein RFI_19660 [Reticulomyxa filosa]|uniref:Uncharacterized protein n=1 Tax=Reticulomyxa filosa TaxID=46433 RepID=X6MUY5_RETFI|nr:hypothetical protein RFI_19660 [Reticulomyxa filosa]|eukprot:ETO17659.1 hypothetical protein RFI_19660 [Reticulomyxa filosa]
MEEKNDSFNISDTSPSLIEEDGLHRKQKKTKLKKEKGNKVSIEKTAKNDRCSCTFSELENKKAKSTTNKSSNKEKKSFESRTTNNVTQEDNFKPGPRLARSKTFSAHASDNDENGPFFLKKKRKNVETDFKMFAGDWIDSKGQLVKISLWGVIRYPENHKLRFEAERISPNQFQVTFDKDPTKKKFVGTLSSDCNTLTWCNDTQWHRKGKSDLLLICKKKGDFFLATSKKSDVPQQRQTKIEKKNTQNPFSSSFVKTDTPSTPGEHDNTPDTPHSSRLRGETCLLM